MVDMKISKAEAERMIVESIAFGWENARHYSKYEKYHIQITWVNSGRRISKPTVTMIVSNNEEN